MAYSTTSDVAQVWSASCVLLHDLTTSMGQVSDLLSLSRGLNPVQSIQLRNVMRDLKLTNAIVEALLSNLLGELAGDLESV